MAPMPAMDAGSVEMPPRGDASAVTSAPDDEVAAEPIDEGPTGDEPPTGDDDVNPGNISDPETEPDDETPVSDDIGLCSGLPGDTPVVAGLSGNQLTIGNAAGEFESHMLPFATTPSDLRFLVDGPKGTAVLVAGEQDTPTHLVIFNAVDRSDFTIELTEANREDHGASFRDGRPSYVIGGAYTATLVRGDGTWTQAGASPMIVGVAELPDSGWIALRPIAEAAFYHFEDKVTKALTFRSSANNVLFDEGRFHYVTTEAANVITLVSEGPEEYQTFESTIPIDAAPNTYAEVSEGFVLVRQDGFPRLALNLETGVAQINEFPPEQGLGELSLSPPWILTLAEGKPAGVHDMNEGQFHTVDVGTADAATRVYGAGDWFMGRDDIEPLWLFNARTGAFEEIDASEPLETKITWESCSPPLSPFDIQTFPQKDGSILTTLRDEYEAGAYLRHPGDDAWHLLGRTVTGVFHLGAWSPGGGAWYISGTPYDLDESEGTLTCTGLGGGEYLSSDEIDPLGPREHQVVSPSGQVFVGAEGQYTWVHPSGRCLFLYDDAGLSEGVDLTTLQHYPFDFEFVNWL